MILREVRKIRNTTPHDIVVVNPETGEVIFKIPPEPEPARVKQKTERIGTLGFQSKEIPLFDTGFEEQVYNLPPEEEGILNVVSLATAQAVGNKRKDLVIPINVLRDAQGRPWGCEGLARYVAS